VFSHYREKTLRKLLLIILLAACASSSSRAALKDFQGVEVFKLRGGGDLGLSGLAWCDNRLYAISDKTNVIYRIDWKENEASVVPFKELPAIPERQIEYSGLARIINRIAGKGFDWEDVACVDERFYLLSERKNAVLEVAGDKARWLPLGWYAAMHRQGYLNRYNAMVEGLARIDDDHWLVAMEREPRGLIFLTRREGTRWRATAFALGNEQDLKFRADNPDVSALAIWNGALYTLERNAQAVCRRDLAHFRALSCYSYAAQENHPRYRYADDRYGMAEGLAIDSRWIYIVFDNNDSSFAIDPLDRRALLLRIPIPAPWRDAF